MTFKFSPIAEKALHIMSETDTSLFVTGKAGTGKSTLLDHFRKNTLKKVVVLAPTGVAAVNVEGETIHSFFGLKPGFEREEVAKIKKPKNAKLLKTLETIVIDEISMVRADLLDTVNVFLQKVREDDRFFGGVQMIFVGDLYQLPPVVTREEQDRYALQYRTPFFFGADVFQEGLDMELLELEEVYRQSDTEFIRILNAVRDNTITNEDIQRLNTRVDQRFDPGEEEYIHLMTTNRDVDIVNTKKLKALKTNPHFFQARINGEVKANMFPAEEKLCLKVGAQVMFLNNDPEGRWVNGTIGEVTDIDEIMDAVGVRLSNGKEVEVIPHPWEVSKYVLEGDIFKREVAGTFTQIPLRLAWAITIHKSQGKTFEKVIIDMGRGAFAHGQTYVALSRCTSLEGIVFRRPIQKTHMIMDGEVYKFFTGEELPEEQKIWSDKEKKQVLQEAISTRSPIKITYEKSPGKSSQRTILPIEVGRMRYRDRSFEGLRAQSGEWGGELTFSLRKIVSIKIDQEST